MIGKTIRHYKILEKLGEGGMGIVYKAEDTKLNRKVAIKFLSEEHLALTEIKMRFLQEAQTASQVDHPNICTIHQIYETEDEGLFIIMSYYEGETLEKKIKDKSISFENSLDYCLQIAKGLKKAHKMGIMHRDIKPANIMVTNDNVVKILDFGLAKPEIESINTVEGLAMGSTAYMSPEQIVGKKIDYKTDIWSLSAVLYECLTGNRAFIGDYIQATIYSILNVEPEPLEKFLPESDENLQILLNKCFQKNPLDRLSDLDDFISTLIKIKDLTNITKYGLKTSSVKISKSKKSFKDYVKYSAIAVSILILTFYVSKLYLNSTKINNYFIENTFSTNRFTNLGKISQSPGWSADGKFLVYSSNISGNMDIWKEPVEGGKKIQLTTSPENETTPAWSNNGKVIAYSSDGELPGIYLIPFDGGQPDNLSSFGVNPMWSPNDEMIAFDWYGDIYIISLKGGDAELIVKGTSDLTYKVWTNDNRSLIYWDRTKGDIYIVDIENKSARSLELIPTAKNVTGITLSKDGKQLAYSSGSFAGQKNLFNVVLDPNTYDVLSTPVSLASTTNNITPIFSPDGKSIAFAVLEIERNLWSFMIGQDLISNTDQGKQITFESDNNYYPSASPNGDIIIFTSHHGDNGHLHYNSSNRSIEFEKATLNVLRDVREIGGAFSPDGSKIAYTSTRDGKYRIWVSILGPSVPKKITDSPLNHRDSFPIWTDDGREIIFYSNRNGNWDIWKVDSDGLNQPEPLTQMEGNQLYHSISPNGRKIAFSTDHLISRDIWIMDTNGENKMPFVELPTDEVWNAWSRDGNWLYFVSNRSGKYNIWKKSILTNELIQVTNFYNLDVGLPDLNLFTKFEVTINNLIIPLEKKLGSEIFILTTVNKITTNNR